MHAVKTLELGKSDKKIKLKLLDPPPFSELPVRGIGREGVVVTGLTRNLF